MKLPTQTGDIFHRLSKGKFICANSHDPHVRVMYDILSESEHFESLRDYFSHIYFDLEQGNQFYYFTRRETKVNLDNKIPNDKIIIFKIFNINFIICVIAFAKN